MGGGPNYFSSRPAGRRSYKHSLNLPPFHVEPRYRKFLRPKYLRSGQLESLAGIRFGYLLESDVPAVKERTVFLDPGDIAVVSASEHKCLVGVTNMGQNLAVALYDPDTKIAAGANIPFVSSRLPIFRFFRPVANAIVEHACKYGAGRYCFYVFNLNSRERDAYHTRNLRKAAHRLQKALEKSGRVLSFEYRNDQNFVLDSRNGTIFSGRPNDPVPKP